MRLAICERSPRTRSHTPNRVSVKHAQRHFPGMAQACQYYFPGSPPPLGGVGDISPLVSTGRSLPSRTQSWYNVDLVIHAGGPPNSEREREGGKEGGKERERERERERVRERERERRGSDAECWACFASCEDQHIYCLPPAGGRIRSQGNYRLPPAGGRIRSPCLNSCAAYGVAIMNGRRVFNTF